MAEPLLRISGVSVRFGGIVALDDVSFDVAEGQICGFIGPNGAGKTTLFNCLSRLYDCNAGDILFRGQSLLKFPRHAIAGLGIGRTFQNLALFGSLSVLDNVMVGGHCRGRSSFFTNSIRLPAVVAEEEELRRRAFELIDFLELRPVAQTPVKALPFGTQKRVELARALVSGPQLLLLDEPAGGLNHEEVEALGALIRHIRDVRRVTIVLVEHHMSLVMKVSDKVVALNFGRKLAEGTPGEIQRNPDVIRSYLGKAA